MFRVTRAAMWMLAVSIAYAACSRQSPTGASGTGGGSAPPAVSTDADLFALVTQTQPFRMYAPFPNLDASAAGVLPASSAHQPLIRVTMNEIAAGALRSGRLVPGTAFPDGSVIFKEVLGAGNVVNLYAVIYKDRGNALAGNGWLWAELHPAGGTEYSVRNRGAACTGCHALDRGAQNDFVRSFERQR